MLDTSRQLDFPPSSPGIELVRRLRASGQPIKLVLQGAVELTVEDDTSFRLLYGLVDRLECIADTREGMKDLDEGRGVSFEEAKDEVRRTLGIPLEVP